MRINTCCVCGSNATVKKNNIGVTLYKCPNCKMMWLEKGELDITEKIEYKSALENLNILRIENYNTILDNMHWMLKENSIGFEIGAAFGLFIKEAENRGYIMSGIEPMEETYLIAKEKGLNVYKGFFPDDMKDIQKVDFIIFNDVFEHIPNILETIEACKNMLNEEGLLIINIPLSTGILFRLSQILDIIQLPEFLQRLWQIKTESPHLYYFNKRNLKLLMENNGFILEKEIKMKTFKVKGLKSRISSIYVSKIKAIFLSVALTMLAPMFNIFPRDTKCFIFKKIK